MYQALAALVFCVSIICLLSGCGKKKENSLAFNAVVIEEHERYIVVEPEQMKSAGYAADGLMLSRSLESGMGFPHVHVGDRVRVEYTGTILATYPARPETVSAVFLLGAEA